VSITSHCTRRGRVTSSHLTTTHRTTTHRNGDPIDRAGLALSGFSQLGCPIDGGIGASPKLALFAIVVFATNCEAGATALTL
jgi:hypothetical protein